jgi:hypothetical protein
MTEQQWDEIATSVEESLTEASGIVYLLRQAIGQGLEPSELRAGLEATLRKTAETLSRAADALEE